MQVTVKMISELRERTQAGMADCKSALVEAEGDMDKAVDVIMKKGLVKAAKTAGKVASEGEVRTWVSADGKHGVIVEVNSQTDFVSRGEDFRSFVTSVIETAATLAPGADLLAAHLKGSDQTVELARQALAGKIGENIVVRRWESLKVQGEGFVHAYIHMGGKNASLVAVETAAHGNADVKSFIDNVAMQIVAMRPHAVSKTDIAEVHVAKQKEIFEGQLKEEGKPEASWAKILEGKIGKWFTEITLLGQDNVWEPGAGTIEKILGEVSARAGGVKVSSFVRFELGEGIEKKTENLADEVAKTIAG